MGRNMNVLAVRADQRTPVQHSVQHSTPTDDDDAARGPALDILSSLHEQLRNLSSALEGVAQVGEPFEPLAFVWNQKFYNKVASATDIDISDESAVRTRALKSTMQQVLDDGEYDDFAVREIRLRRVDPTADADLLNVNPRAHWIAEADGVDGTGTAHTIPSVVNRDGAVFVDPRIRGL